MEEGGKKMKLESGGLYGKGDTLEIIKTCKGYNSKLPTTF